MDIMTPVGFPHGSDGKESAYNAKTQVQSLGQEYPQKREWLPTPVFLPGEFHRRSNLESYSPWGPTTERLMHSFSQCRGILSSSAPNVDFSNISHQGTC